MPLMMMKHDQDPAQDLMEQVGDLSEIDIFHNQVMVAVYIRPEKTASGIILTTKTREEDRYQGKVGLIVKKGPTAFEPDGKWFTEDQKFEIGDWVFFRPSDTWQMTVKNKRQGATEHVLCRLMDDIAIRGKITDPDLAW